MATIDEIVSTVTFDVMVFVNFDIQAIVVFAARSLN